MHRVFAAVGAATLAVALASCVSATPAVPDRSDRPGDSGSARNSSAAGPTGRPRGSASALLATIAVKGRAPLTGYDRDRFGSAWTDDNDDPLGHNGCDTRNDVLRRDLSDVVLKPGSNGCAVAAGRLHDPYTGAVIRFRRGERTSAAVQIDHVVALGDAWQTGAQGWTDQQRTDLANDPLELLAVDGPANESKGDGDAATWLPPNRSFRCAYVARQVAVKARYRLWMTVAEQEASARVLATCPGEPAPSEGGAPPTGWTSSPARGSSTTGPSTSGTSTPDPPTADSPTPGPSASVSYADCAAVRAAGEAPLRRGQPGYRSVLDGDRDGVACE